MNCHILTNVPRFVVITLNSKVQIHEFADASMEAYGCCIYVRYSESNVMNSKLLVAKSKVVRFSFVGKIMACCETDVTEKRNRIC